MPWADKGNAPLVRRNGGAQGRPVKGEGAFTAQPWDGDAVGTRAPTGDTPQRGTLLAAHGSAVGNPRPHGDTPQRGTHLVAHGNAVGNPRPHGDTPQRGTLGMRRTALPATIP